LKELDDYKNNFIKNKNIKKAVENITHP